MRAMFGSQAHPLPAPDEASRVIPEEAALRFGTMTRTFQEEQLALFAVIEKRRLAG